MVVMAIMDMPEEERKLIIRTARDQAARYTDERWNYIESGSVTELESSLETVESTDMICLDVTMNGSIEAAKRLRARYPGAYLILVADTTISPVTYLRPSIKAESLMLKPLNEDSIDQTMGEAIGTYARRVQNPDEDLFFVVETRGERRLVEYSRILFFESREKKVFLSTEMEEYGFYDTLDELEQQLEPGFIRCHRSFLVNRSMIQKLELSKNSLLLTDGTRIPVSRSCKQAVREYVGSVRQREAFGASQLPANRIV